MNSGIFILEKSSKLENSKKMSAFERNKQEIEIGSILWVNPGNKNFVVDSIFRDSDKDQIVIRVRNEIDQNN